MTHMIYTDDVSLEVIQAKLLQEIHRTSSWRDKTVLNNMINAYYPSEIKKAMNRVKRFEKELKRDIEILADYDNQKALHDENLKRELTALVSLQHMVILKHGDPKEARKWCRSQTKSSAKAGDVWQYCEVYRPGHVANDIHVFFFAKADDAMLFKLKYG